MTTNTDYASDVYRDVSSPANDYLVCELTAPPVTNRPATAASETAVYFYMIVVITIKVGSLIESGNVFPDPTRVKKQLSVQIREREM